MTRLQVALYDAFSATVFGGNVAGVVPRAEGLSDLQMQQVAAELAAPTTGFAVELPEGGFSLRFFTPAMEIDMCGHVVVGVFSCLADDGRIAFDAEGRASLRNLTKAGEIPVTLRRGAGDRACRVMMRQNLPRFGQAAPPAAQLAPLLGIAAGMISPAPVPAVVGTALRHLFIPLVGLDAMAALKPDFAGLATLSRALGVETVAPYCLDCVEAGHDLHLRDLCPAIGNPEEAASGTTNGALACHLLAQGLIGGTADGVTRVLGEQGMEMGRPSLILSEITQTAGAITAVRVGGQAVCALRGEIFLP